MTDLFQIIDAANLWEEVPELKRGAFLKTEGVKDLNLYFVEYGCLRVFITAEDTEHTIRLGYVNNFISALDSFIAETPSDYNIQAVKKTKVKKVKKSALMALVLDDPELMRIWIELLENLVFQQLEREKDLLISSPKSRYLKVLKRSPILFQEVPHKYIASYLRMTPETLSRMKKS